MLATFSCRKPVVICVTIIFIYFDVFFILWAFFCSVQNLCVNGMRFEPYAFLCLSFFSMDVPSTWMRFRRGAEPPESSGLTSTGAQTIPPTSSPSARRCSQEATTTKTSCSLIRYVIRFSCIACDFIYVSI